MGVRLLIQLPNVSVDNVLTQTIQSTLDHHSRQQLRQPHAQLTQIVPDHTLVTQHHQPVSALIHWNGSILHGNVARVVLKMQTVPSGICETDNDCESNLVCSVASGICVCESQIFWIGDQWSCGTVAPPAPLVGPCLIDEQCPGVAVCEAAVGT